MSYEHSSAQQPVTVSLAITVAQSTGGGGFDTLNGFENLWGGSGGDRLTGNGGDNILTGAAGRDTLDGGGGTDTANYYAALSSSLTDSAVIVDLRISGPQDTGGSNVDTLISIENLIGGEGPDTLTGNAGANVIEGGERNDLLDGQGGSDTASYAGALAGVTVSLALTGAQNTVGAGTDTLISFENLRGSAFGDRLTGDAGANRLEGLGAGDTLVGGGGMDTLVGGDGNDLYTNDSADQIVEAAGGGTDRVQSATSYTLGANVEYLTLTGSAAISGTGNTAANLIVGNGGANTLSGGGGNDTLTGGAGTDRLDGGTGADVFDFNAEGDSTAAAPDVIAQFDGAGAAADDRIDLSGIDANLGLSGDQSFTFNSTAAGGLSLATSGSDTLVRGNTDGDSAFEFTIRIADGATVATAYTAADFIL